MSTPVRVRRPQTRPVRLDIARARPAPCRTRPAGRAHRSAGTGPRPGRASARISACPSASPVRKCPVPRRQVEMVQVIGLHPHRDEAAEQRLERRRIVVHAFQQHRSAPEPGCRRARAARHGGPRRRRSARADGWRGSRHRPPSRPRARATSAALTRPGSTTGTRVWKRIDAEMRDRVERRDDRADAARRQHERIAAGDDHLPDLGIVRGCSRARPRARLRVSVPAFCPTSSRRKQKRQ